MNVSRRAFLTGGTAAVLATGCVSGRRAVWPFKPTPELRFGVLSDIHVTTPESTALLRKALAYFRKRQVDAVMIAGDLTDWGCLSSLRYVKDAWDSVFEGTATVPLFCTGNHDYDGWSYDDMSAEMRINGYEANDAIEKRGGMRDCWERVFDEPFEAIRVRTVKGFDFVSVEYRDTAKFPEWMEKNSSRFKAGRPFFCFQHLPPQGIHTVGGRGWEDKGASVKALGGFPNAVLFTGHVHRPFNDERMIWQGGFTSISVPSLSYASFPIMDSEGHLYENGYGKRNGTDERAMDMLPTRRDQRGGQGFVVSVYPWEMKIERIDIEANCCEGAPAWTVPLPMDPSNPPMSFTKRGERSVAPEFPKGARVEAYTRNVNSRQGKWAIGMTCRFPSATMPDGGRVYDYLVKAVTSNGEESAFHCFLTPSYAKLPECEPETQVLWFNAEDLPEDVNFRLEVRARNCFGRVSAPLVSRYLRTARKGLKI